MAPMVFLIHLESYIFNTVLFLEYLLILMGYPHHSVFWIMASREREMEIRTFTHGNQRTEHVNPKREETQLQSATGLT